MVDNIQVRGFLPQDQESVHTLILQGLADRFGVIDPSLNPDLRDIDANYIQQGSLFLVAELEGQIVGTGALIDEAPLTARIVRVSVANSHRRMGIGRLLTKHLIVAARESSYRQIVVETNDDWHDAIRLYQNCGFTRYDHFNGEVHMSLQLTK